jgi:hypothetical protein
MAAMKDSLKVLLNNVKDGLLDIGTSIDIENHGSGSEANEVYDGGRNAIQRAIHEASDEDREVFHHLFGFETDFNKTSWSVAYEYILELLKTDPKISLERLRVRLPNFIQILEKLKTSDTAITKTLSFWYRRPTEPSLLTPFIKLIAEKSGPPGWYYEFDGNEITSFHFSIKGEGLRIRNQNKMFEYDLLLRDVWIHCRHPMHSRHQEIKIVYENSNRGKEVVEELVPLFKNQSWEIVES